jgi:hypothetical protein
MPTASITILMYVLHLNHHFILNSVINFKAKENNKNFRQLVLKITFFSNEQMNLWDTLRKQKQAQGHLTAFF